MECQEYKRGISLYTSNFNLLSKIMLFFLTFCEIYVSLLIAFTVLTDTEAAEKTQENIAWLFNGSGSSVIMVIRLHICQKCQREGR